jgi:hypothetical protein
VIAIVVAALAGGSCSLVCMGYLGYRRAQMSTIRQLVEIRARLPQYHEDSLVMGRDTSRIVFRAWLDGAQLAILHEDVKAIPGHARFYLLNGALLACSTSAHKPRGKYRDVETAILYDAAGHPLTGWVEVDGQRRSLTSSQMETLHAMHEKAIKSFWENYTHKSFWEDYNNPQSGH